MPRNLITAPTSSSGVATHRHGTATNGPAKVKDGLLVALVSVSYMLV